MTSPGSGQFVSRLVELAWTSCSDPRARNAISRAASYVNPKFALREEPEERSTASVAILGMPEARTDYLRALARRKKSKRE